jgi:hypothetical protein
MDFQSAKLIMQKIIVLSEKAKHAAEVINPPPKDPLILLLPHLFL